MFNQYEDYVYLLLISVGGLVMGFLIEKLILKKAEQYDLLEKWKFNDLVLYSLRGLIAVWATILCFSISINYFTINETFLHLSNKISFSVLVLTFSIFTSRILVKLLKLKTSDTSGKSPSTSIILNIIRIVIFMIGFMMILHAFGISITPILTALGVGGLAVALALQETLSNLFSGIQVIAANKIRNGDYIKLDSGEEGYVLDITWRSTIIKALQNNTIIIPNSKLSTAIVTNFDFPETELAFSIEVGVSYDSNLELVEQLTIKTAKEVLNRVENGVKDFEPLVRYHTFSDSSINFTVILRGREFGGQFLIKHELIKALSNAYKENHIEIPFPIRSVYIKNDKA